jgi:FtsH-binding integral membrane protein
VDTTEKQSLLYQENAKVAATFWEWRHKIMTYTFSVIAALLGLTAWLHAHQHKAGWLEAVPIGFGGMLAFLAAGLDARNAQILHHCYRIGAEIESEWHNQTNPLFHGPDGGTFQAILASSGGKITYTTLLRYSLTLVGTALLVTAAVVVARR